MRFFRGDWAGPAPARSILHLIQGALCSVEPVDSECGPKVRRGFRRCRVEWRASRIGDPIDAVEIGRYARRIDKGGNAHFVYDPLPRDRDGRPFARDDHLRKGNQQRTVLDTRVGRCETSGDR